MLSKIDLNCDLGESYGTYDGTRDATIMPYLSSCNIACGFHSGDPLTIMKTIKLALKHEVAIGAHPSYPDLQGFGRRVMDLTGEKLEACVLYQVSALKCMTESLGGILHHVKPHGAMYNQAAKDEETAAGIVKAVSKVQKDMLIYAPPRSVLSEMALQSGLRVRSEVFADRRYENDLSLRDRLLDGAVLQRKEEVLKQLKGFLEGEVQTYDGKKLPIEAETLCLHSDTAGAEKLAKEIHDFLIKHNVSITSD